MDSKKTVLALNGELTGNFKEYHSILGDADYFIGADGGTHLLEELGLFPDIIIGDLDSLTEEEVRKYQQNGVKVYQYPIDKDETDGELAIDFCYENDLKNIVIIGSTGGRIDQQLANIFLLEYACQKGLEAIIKEPGLEIGLIVETRIFINKKGYQLSLLPLSKVASGVVIQGCKYSLKGETLFRYKTRGLSNSIINNTASVSLEEGILLYIIKDMN
jgi:thiamine pyrophosphokinase